MKAQSYGSLAFLLLIGIPSLYLVGCSSRFPSSVWQVPPGSLNNSGYYGGTGSSGGNSSTPTAAYLVIPQTISLEPILLLDAASSFPTQGDGCTRNNWPDLSYSQLNGLIQGQCGNNSGWVGTPLSPDNPAGFLFDGSTNGVDLGSAALIDESAVHTYRDLQ